MRAHGLQARRPRRHEPRTTDSEHTHPVAPNLLGRDITAPAPNRKWVADITSIPIPKRVALSGGDPGRLLATGLGYALDRSRDERLVEAALDMALVDRRPRAGLHHSDRGSQYTVAYRSLLEGYGIVLSMSVGEGAP